MQVLNNLISNAIKFTANGGTITISGYKVNSLTETKWRYKESTPEVPLETKPMVVVSVSDSGIGIPTDRISELFSKFKQLRPMDTNNQGTGLGLVIAKGIIESHGGNVYVQSHANEGTTFYFTLPLSTNPPV